MNVRRVVSTVEATFFPAPTLTYWYPPDLSTDCHADRCNLSAAYLWLATLLSAVRAYSTP